MGMPRVPKRTALVIVIGLTLASIAVLGIAPTACVYVIIVGMVILYQAVASRA